MKVGFVGLGKMGYPMARNIVRAGHTVTVYNRTRSRSEALQGTKVASSPAEAATGEVAITMLSDDTAVEHVVLGPDGVSSRLPENSIHVSMSTISVALSKRLTELHRSRGQLFISAPVFGRPEAAEAAKLFIIAAGEDANLGKVQPLFDVVGQRTFHVGQIPYMANAIKLAGNFMIASVIETLGEAFALVRRHDVRPEVFLDVITNSLFDAPVYRSYGGIVCSAKYEPVGFQLALGLKDIRLALEAAGEVAVPMPLASILRDRFLAGVANGMSHEDWSSIARLVAETAGLKG